MAHRGSSLVGDASTKKKRKVHNELMRHGFWKSINSKNQILIETQCYATLQKLNVITAAIIVIFVVIIIFIIIIIIIILIIII